MGLEGTSILLSTWIKSRTTYHLSSPKAFGFVLEVNDPAFAPKYRGSRQEAMKSTSVLLYW